MNMSRMFRLLNVGAPKPKSLKASMFKKRSETLKEVKSPAKLVATHALDVVFVAFWVTGSSGPQPVPNPGSRFSNHCWTWNAGFGLLLGRNGVMPARTWE